MPRVSRASLQTDHQNPENAGDEHHLRRDFMCGGKGGSGGDDDKDTYTEELVVDEQPEELA